MNDTAIRLRASAKSQHPMTAILEGRPGGSRDPPAHPRRSARSTDHLAFRLAVLMSIGSTGTFAVPARVVVLTFAILSTTSMPSITLPKTA